MGPKPRTDNLHYVSFIDRHPSRHLAFYSEVDGRTVTPVNATTSTAAAAA